MALIEIDNLSVAYGTPQRPVLERTSISTLRKGNSSACWARPDAASPRC